MENNQLNYPESLLSKQDTEAQESSLDTNRMPCHVDIKDIDKLPNEQYAMLRKNGLGGSDSSVVLGVNPYKTIPQLIAEKCETELSEEELQVRNQIAVRKGVDLEPLIINKSSKILSVDIVKPTDMYVHNEFPYLKMNFDGVINDPKQYVPVEIKVVTSKGERHYTPAKAIYIESVGWLNKEPQHFELGNNSIQTKASQYGIPPYYYTQLQQEIMFADAPFGYLATLQERSWNIVIFKVWRDQKCINDIIVQGGLVWDKIQMRKSSIIS